MFYPHVLSPLCWLFSYFNIENKTIANCLCFRVEYIYVYEIAYCNFVNN